MPSTFDKLGIRFQYPDNWTLDEHDALEGDNTVTVYSPGGGFWSVSLYAGRHDPDELARAVLATMRQEYNELDAESVRESVAGRELIGFDLNFYCLDLTNTALVRSFSTSAAAWLILCQADDREFDQMEPVFRAMTLSLLQSCP